MPNTVLINPESGAPEQFEPNAANAALQQGYHVPLMAPNGDAVSAGYHEAADLVQNQGHAQLTPEQLQQLVESGHYQSPGQQALAFAEGALESGTGGMYGAVAGHTGLTTPEDILKREHYNPGTHALGEGAGIVGGVFLAPEASVPGLITRAGESAAAQIAARGVLTKAAKTAIAASVEGGLYGASHAASERLLGNPDETAEHMLSTIGLSAALGGGLGLVMSPIAQSVGKAVEMGAGYLGKEVDGAARAIKTEPLEHILPYTGLSQEERSSVIKGLQDLKPNVKDINAAEAELQKIDPEMRFLESQKSDSKFVQDLDSSLMKDPTWTGIQRQQSAQRIFNTASKAVDEALGNDLGLTKAQVGDSLKKGLSEALESEYKPINTLYEQIKSTGQHVPLEESALKSTAKEMLNTEGLMSSKGLPISENSPGYQLAKRVSEELPNLGTIDDLRLYSQRLGQDTLGQPELKYVTGQLQSKIRELEEASILNSVKGLSPEEQAPIQQLLVSHQEAKSKYGELRNKISDLGDVIGKKLRKGEGPGAFLEWLDSTAPEKIADKLFTKNNSKFLDFLKSNFPEQSELLANLKKSQLRDMAVENGRIVPSKILKQIDKLEPEIQKFLFAPEDLAKISAANTALESFPKNVNPSETAKTINLMELFKHPLALPGAQASSLIKQSLIKALVKSGPSDAPLITALLHIDNLATKTSRNIEKYAGGIFGRAGASALKQDEEPAALEREPYKVNKLGTMVLNHANNPEGLIEHLSEKLAPIQNYAPETVSGFNSGVGRAVSFLASKAPTDKKMSPLDKDMPPSNTEIAKFNRYASVVEDPTSVLKYVKADRLLPQDLEALNAVYPGLYSKMRQTVTEKIINATSKGNELSYKTKLGLSMFLGQNLDSTLLPQSIISNQLSLSFGNMQKAQQEAQMAKPSKTGMRDMHVREISETPAQSAAMRRARQ